MPFHNKSKRIRQFFTRKSTLNICPFSGNNVLNMTEEDVAVDSTSFSYKIVYRELVVVQRVTEKFDSMDGMRMMKKNVRTRARFVYTYYYKCRHQYTSNNSTDMTGLWPCMPQLLRKNGPFSGNYICSLFSSTCIVNGDTILL